MLRVVAQQASRVVRAPALARGFALEGTKFSEGEKAIEDLYFTKEDQRLMAKLMAKVRKASIMSLRKPGRTSASLLKVTESAHSPYLACWGCTAKCGA